MRRSTKGLATILCALFAGMAAVAHGQDRVDPKWEAEQNRISTTPIAGGEIPHDLEFVTQEGKTIQIGELFDGERPVILSLVYYRCPMLCQKVSQGLIRGLMGLNWTIGQEYQVVVLSIDPRDDPESAAGRRELFAQSYDRGDIDGLTFLTGEDENIRAVADAIGFGYEWHEDTQEYAHGAAIFVLTPDGVVSRYHQGIEFESSNLKFSLIEAGRGKVGNVWDRLSFHCLSWDPETGKWIPAMTFLANVAACLVFLGLILVIVVAQRSRKRDTTTDTPAGVTAGTQT